MQIKTLHDRPYVNLDLIDRKIIGELSKNSRVSYTELGKEVGLSRVAVQQRINALSESGVIDKFTVAIEPYKAGIYVTALFEISVDPAALEEVAETLRTHSFVTYLFQMTGPSRLNMIAQFNDHQEMESYIKSRLYVIRGITNVDFQIIIHMYKNQFEVRPLDL